MSPDKAKFSEILAQETKWHLPASLRSGQKANPKWQKQNAKKPAAHLIGKQPSPQNTLEWISKNEVAFLRKIKHPLSTTVVVPRQGLYYLYCQVAFEGLDTDLSLSSQVLTLDKARNETVTLTLGTESVFGPPSPHEPWRASLTLGGLADLQKGQKLYVHVSHPHLVDYREGKTYFGIVMVS
ncbi:lymphotoxin-beta-like isoform X2 [Hyla sarda]|uniref:lymphotoxin-beta-like isoform X2 n=1 Tax=Hyla sarda TaxID=327740 RepID=UPI0024C3E6A9|nr:lymphotoxin-beta-like isoform X2 [Hyla sarda]